MTPTDPPNPESGELQRWNSRFSAADYVFGTEPNGFLVSQRERLATGMRALCIGDGEGRNSAWLAQQGLQVTAFDFSPVAVSKAQALARRLGVQVDYRINSLEDWQWQPAQYDVVAAIFVQFADPALRARMFAGIVETLRPGGLLLLQGYRPEQLAYGTGGPKKLEHLYTEELLRESLGGLTWLHFASHDDELREGKGHHGMSALIDLVARKDEGSASGAKGSR